MELTNLKRGTLVTYKGQTGRVLLQYLNPNVKPGIKRVTYSFERAYIQKDGTVKFGVFKSIVVPASALTIVS